MDISSPDAVTVSSLTTNSIFYQKVHIAIAIKKYVGAVLLVTFFILYATTYVYFNYLKLSYHFMQPF